MGVQVAVAEAMDSLLTYLTPFLMDGDGFVWHTSLGKIKKNKNTVLSKGARVKSRLLDVRDNQNLVATDNGMEVR